QHRGCERRLHGRKRAADGQRREAAEDGSGEQGLQVAPTNNGAGFSITPVANGRCVGHLNPNPFTEQD
ncbi:MAG TPA: hypothetical protein VFC99_00215, partial [Acidimicrobiia bacterium]|nr:hypothetical protein [Acidimicrobiia bacterium]